MDHDKFPECRHCREDITDEEERIRVVAEQSDVESDTVQRRSSTMYLFHSRCFEEASSLSFEDARVIPWRKE